MSESRFRFRLQRLLELRRLREQESAREAAAARRETEAARAAVAQLGSVRAAGAAELARVHVQPRTAGEIQRVQLLLGHLDRHIAQADSALQDAEERMAEKLAQLNGAARMRQVLDRLRDRQRELWRIETQHSERKQLDEVAVLRHQRDLPGTTEAHG